MLLFWKIRYLDTRDRQFKDRELWLDTVSLLPATKAEVELYLSTPRSSDRRKMLKYRHFFKEEHVTHQELEQRLRSGGEMESFCVVDYFEDENGGQLTLDEIAKIRSGSPTAVSIPPGAKQHDIEYMMAEKGSIALDRISLTTEQLKLLGYFSRDFRELSESAFMRDGPGTIRGNPTGGPALETAVTDDEIRSFVIIFRRLYMQKEPSNFLKAAAVAERALDSHPLGKWIAGSAKQYEDRLDEKRLFVPFFRGGEAPFTRKRLIDVYLYTRYIHQPNEGRAKQYQECLTAVGNRQEFLTWLFLTAIWECSLAMMGAGRIIVDLYQRYCQYHAIEPDILDSILRENPGVGTAEKQEARTERLLGEKAKELAKAIWESKGRPDGGHLQFVDEARERLRQSLE